MATFIAFLRAVNLGRNRKLPMADARSWLEAAGLADVETYIQTGNVRLTTPLRSRTKVERLVEEVLGERCGFDVPAIVVSPAELREVHADALRLTSPLEGVSRQYVTFLKEEPGAAAAATIDAWDHDGEAAKVVGRTVHWWLAKTNQQARIGNARIEKDLGVGTTRDVKVVTTLAERWGA
jgi:uncharacterized protein (DUF1697 family)